MRYMCVFKQSMYRRRNFTSIRCYRRPKSSIDKKGVARPIYLSFNEILAPLSTTAVQRSNVE